VTAGKRILDEHSQFKALTLVAARNLVAAQNRFSETRGGGTNGQSSAAPVLFFVPPPSYYKYFGALLVFLTLNRACHYLRFRREHMTPRTTRSWSVTRPPALLCPHVKGPGQGFKHRARRSYWNE